MDKLGGPSMFHFTLLIFLLGVATQISAHSLALHHLRKEKCPTNKDMTFPSTMTVSLNVTRQSRTSEGEVGKHSTSPWDYRDDANPNRIPSLIYEAVCRHNTCLDSEGNLDQSLNSVPIKQEILVLYREMKGCMSIFKLDKKTVTVGCTCVQPKLSSLPQ